MLVCRSLVWSSRSVRGEVSTGVGAGSSQAASWRNAQALKVEKTAARSARAGERGSMREGLGGKVSRIPVARAATLSNAALWGARSADAAPECLVDGHHHLVQLVEPRHVSR